MKITTIEIPIVITITARNEVDENKIALIKKHIKHSIEMCDENESETISVGAIENILPLANTVNSVSVGDGRVTHVAIVDNTNELTINLPLSKVVMNDEACNDLGYNPYCVNEGADGNALVKVRLSDAKKWGFV